MQSRCLRSNFSFVTRQTGFLRSLEVSDNIWLSENSQRHFASNDSKRINKKMGYPNKTVRPPQSYIIHLSADVYELTAD
jgi:ABC-type lipoprotein export system ATPase subunit